MDLEVYSTVSIDNCIDLNEIKKEVSSHMSHHEKHENYF